MTTQSEAGMTTRSTWQLDPAHMLVEFSGKHMMFTRGSGHFKIVRGDILLDEADPSRSAVEVEIDKKLTFLTIYKVLSYAYSHRGSLSWKRDLSLPFPTRHFQ